MRNVGWAAAEKVDGLRVDCAVSRTALYSRNELNHLVVGYNLVLLSVIHKHLNISIDP